MSAQSDARLQTDRTEVSAPDIRNRRPPRRSPISDVFRVTNKNVPYPLGFWLRGDGLISRVRLPSVSGGGLILGTTQDYAIELKEGDYVYSCPLNPTPDYKLIVRR